LQEKKEVSLSTPTSRKRHGGIGNFYIATAAFGFFHERRNSRQWGIFWRAPMVIMKMSLIRTKAKFLASPPRRSVQPIRPGEPSKILAREGDETDRGAGSRDTT
jgi:hypothetical protein